MHNDQDPVILNLKHGDAYLLPTAIYVIFFQHKDLQRFCHMKLQHILSFLSMG